MRNIAIIFAFLTAIAAYSQSAVSPATKTPAQAVDAKKNGVALPRGLSGIELDMNIEDVKKKLSGAPLFDYRGEPDVSLVPREKQSLIECAGFSFVKRAWFQFYEDKLFAILVSVNDEKMDYYSIFTRFTGDFGNPAELDPRQSIWTDGATRLSLEKPLMIKYLDVKTFDTLKANIVNERAMGDISRDLFLDLLSPSNK